MKYKLTFALVALMTTTAFAAFQAPLPEFKTEKQLAEWRAERANESTGQRSAVEETAFYTGKPYVASSGTYAFKFRSYDSELARWTSEDPSGFPDGANGNIYAPIPTMNVDVAGLWRIVITSTTNSYSDATGPQSDMGILLETIYRLSYSMSATTSYVTGFAVSTSQNYDRFTGTAFGNPTTGAGQDTVSIGLTSQGYLTSNVPGGAANTDGVSSGGIGITGVGFDGGKRVGSITVSVNAAYKGVVTFTASTGGLGYAPAAHAQSLAVTKTFTYEVVE